MTKTISSRIDNRVHGELLERCNKIGCNINEFVAESVKFMLTGESDYEFGLDEEEISSEEPIVSEITNVKLVE